MIPVIIPAYKNKDQLEKCITYLNNQTVPVEIFVRDNSDDNIYFTAAVNEGLRKYLEADCKYILILNQDMYLDPDAVEKMAAFMDIHPKCGIGAPLQLNSQDRNSVICAGGREAFPFGKHFCGNASNFIKDGQIFWANGACMILRKEMIREIGLLDEKLVFVGSDSDYSFTARSRGWQVWCIVSARGIHECGASGTISNPTIEALKIRDMVYFGEKWLTGELYGELAYKKYPPKTVSSIMTQLKSHKK